jgi:ABC-type microcin C transport system permease subunit YejB
MRSAFRPRRVLVAGLATATLLGVSGVAFAVVQSVDSSPQPQVVIPASASVGTDEPLTHDARDDRNRGTEQRHGADDPATHDVRDDNGVDDPATHDVRDDNGVDDPATHDVGDDHGGSTSRHGGDDATPEPVRSADDHGGHGRDG